MGLSEKHLAGGEKILLRLRTHWKVLVGPIALLLALIAVVLLTWWLVDRQGWSGWVVAVVGMLAAGAAIYLTLIPFLRWQTTRYVITNRRVAHRYGILNKHGRDIPLHRINTIGVEKSLWDRILGCGSLTIADATTKDGLVLDDVPKVVNVQTRLQELLYRNDDGSDDGEWPPNEPDRDRGRDTGRQAPELS